MIDADQRHTVVELEALIDAFGHRLHDTQLLLATPADLRGSSLVVDHRAWLDGDSELFGILIDADTRRGTRFADRYYERSLEIAHVVASLDVMPADSELAAISALRTRLLAGLRRRGIARRRPRTRRATRGRRRRSERAGRGCSRAAARGAPRPSSTS